MIVHVVAHGVSDGALGVGLDVMAAGARLVASGAAPSARGAATLEQRVVSVDGRSVQSGSGRPVHVDGVLRARDVGAGDVLLLPGLSAATATCVERLLARADIEALAAILRRAETRGATIAASCSATFVLGASGVLDGRDATTTWWLAPEFRRRFPRVSLVSDRMVIEDGRIFTAGSAFAHADLALTVLSRIAGPTVAHLAARFLVLDTRESQARYMVLDYVRTDDEAVRNVERHVAKNLERRISLAEMAKVARSSPRTLARRVHEALGMTPTDLVQRIRIARASHLLETTKLSVDEIAARVGYADPAAFRRVFRKLAGQAPSGLRGSVERSRAAPPPRATRA